MKKILSLLLSLVLVFSLVACGDNKQTEESAGESVEESTEEAAESDAESTEESAEEEATGNLEGNINVYTRDSASGTRGAFEELIEFEGELTEKAAETSGNGDMATKVGQDANAIGYVSLTTDFEANNLKAVKFEGAEASEENVLNGSYTLKRPFSFVTRETGTYESEEVEQLVDAFIAFITKSTEGLEAVASEGGIVDVESGEAWEEIKKDYPVVDQDNSGLTIRTGGSTSVVNTLDAAIEAFKPLAGNVQFVSDHTGSGDGYKRTLGEEKDGANAADIGFASRDFKDEEDVSKGKESGQYAQDAVVVVVEKNSPVEDLTKQNVYDIFTGAVSTWEEVK